MDALIFSIAFAFAAALVFLAAAAADRKVTVAFALLGALYLGLDDLVTGLASEFAVFSLPGTNWNWTGKIFSLLLSALVIVALRLSPDAVGLTLRQNDRKIGIAAVVFFVLWGTCLGLLFKPGQADLETLAFQATMPGISEELVYRGICPAILLGLIHRRTPVQGTPWAVILATSIVFGIWHGLRYSGGDFSFDPMSALIPLVGSIPGGWLRFRTGSLLVPVLGHAIANVAFHVAGGIVA
ncbi:MAG TPA: CPBP family intramembrane glutamic endopeptidase [Longimicrobium sp.]|nr:CPBP family intramembrane glutamic endopeptidase [Longimicrobium sp.]